jgi:Xaa-Pro aminopeptidase
MPHHEASERPIQTGETITIDMGCRAGGYCSDLTRTVVLGEPGARFWEIYDLVLRAQQTCEDHLKAGMTGKAGDELARKVIADAGHAEHFGHGTGHGVGLAIHEDPRLTYTQLGEMTLPEGAVVTVEPGVYLPGWGGVRIEDMVVVGRDRCHILTTAHKAPIIEIES